jgi:septum formation protein
MKKLILASQSTRRHELLNLLGIPHEVIPCDSSEKKITGKRVTDSQSYNKKEVKKVHQLLTAVALQKAECVGETLSKAKKQQSFILAADTIVMLKGEILGKPKSLDDAFLMLRKLRGKTHYVYSALCIYDPEKDISVTDIEKTAVHMIKCSDERLKAYIKSESVLDKAGAYALQGKAAFMIDMIEGCYYNVLGLPISKLIMLLDKIGYHYIPPPLGKTNLK